jgi:hypothetical protein
MNRTWIALAAVFLAAIFGMSLSSYNRSNRAQEGVAGGVKPMTVAPVVIVELFTSEGCSSCPPADQLLKKLSEEQPIHGVQVVALEEHVDYWNHQGWKDPFSDAEFSRRQEDYAGAIHNGGVYTPQMIVDGQVEVTGSQGRKAWEAIEQSARMPKAIVEVSPAAGEAGPSATLDLRVSNAPGEASRKKLELWLALTEKGLQSDVKAGENSGETLQHAAVVRSLQKIAVVQADEPFTKRVTPNLKQEWKREQLSLVAFLVEKGSRKIVGGAMTPFISKN